jgi:hypothetical protein
VRRFVLVSAWVTEVPLLTELWKKWTDRETEKFNQIGSGPSGRNFARKIRIVFSIVAIKKFIRKMKLIATKADEID